LVVWQGFLETAALGMGTTTSQAGLILSMIFTVALVIVIAIATKGEGAEVVIPSSSLLGMLLFLALGWMPAILGSIVALLSALFVIQVVMR